MVTIKMNIFKEPELKNPILVCGLPGSGFVGKLAVEHLAKELSAELFGLIYSHNFPPQVLIKSDGTLDIMKNELYCWKSEDHDNDLILYTGDSQPITPDADYEIAEKILELGEKLGVKKVFTLAAYITGGFVKEPKVYGTATDTSAINELRNQNVILMKEGSITGMNGLLVGLAKLRGIQGFSLLGETSGYIVDASASQAVLTVFSKILNIKIDMTTLTERAKSTEAVVNTFDQLRRVHEAPSETKRGKEKELGYIS